MENRFTSQAMGLSSQDMSKLVLKMNLLKKQMEKSPMTSADQGKVSGALEARMAAASTNDGQNQIVDEFATFMEENMEALNQMNSAEATEALLSKIQGDQPEEGARATSGPSPLSIMSGSLKTGARSVEDQSAMGALSVEIPDDATAEDLTGPGDKPIGATSTSDDELVASIMRTIDPEKIESVEPRKGDGKTEPLPFTLFPGVREILDSDLSQEDKEMQIKDLMKDWYLQEISPEDPEYADKIQTAAIVAEIMAKLMVEISDPNLSDVEIEEKISQGLDKIADIVYPEPPVPEFVEFHKPDNYYALPPEQKKIYDEYESATATTNAAKKNAYDRKIDQNNFDKETFKRETRVLLLG